MKTKILLFVFPLLISVQVIAQKNSTNDSYYKSALGVKVWDGGGISFKHFLNDDHAAEFIGYFWSRGFRLGALYEFHHDLANVAGLRWYVGPGVHIGVYDYYNGNHRVDGMFIGIDGVLGLDYKFANAPINLSLDWQPSFEFGEYVGFNGNWGGLGIRYTF